jgi:hypothetical protein
MPKKEFKDAADKKINDYFITLPAMELDLMRQQVRPFDFKRKLGDWVAGETGCVPSIEIDKNSVNTDSPKMLIQCTASLMAKIEAQFADEIGSVEYLRKLSDIPPSDRGCWKPRRGR